MSACSELFASRRGFRARSVLCLTLGLWLTACGFRSDNSGLTQLRAQIREQIGTDAAITVHTSEGATTVTVRLERLPSGDSKETQARVEALAKAEFPKTNYVVVTSQ